MARGTTLGIFRDGGFASRVVAPAGSLHAVPVRLHDQPRAALAEPLSCIENSIRRLPAPAPRTALVLGAGPSGALYALRLGVLGTRLVVVEASAERAALLQDAIGAAGDVWTCRLVPDGVNELSDRLRSHLGGNLPELVVEAGGDLANAAYQLTQPGGTTLLMGMNRNAPPIQVDAYEHVRRQRRLIGSYIGKGCFESALHTLAEGLPGVERLADTIVPLDRVIEAGLPAMGLDPLTGCRVPCARIKILVQVEAA
jgi:threonine dehydrogenase-like Zn-dependent dehydrogenase